ncbi:MAG: hypothetical protein ABR518_09320 [Actinomycetota bacterium]
MTSSRGQPVSIGDVRRAVGGRAFLFDNPHDYLAGVEDAIAALTTNEARVVVVEEGGREEWLRTLEQYRAACGPPTSEPARSFESTLERQLSA